MAREAIACFTSRKCLRAGGALSAARAQVEDGFAPAAHALLHEAGDRINLHALCTPAKRAVWRRVAAPNYVHPKALLRRRAEKMDFDIEVLLNGAFPHLGQRCLYHFNNGRYLNPGVGADDGDFFLPLLCRDGLDGIEDERSD